MDERQFLNQTAFDVPALAGQSHPVAIASRRSRLAAVQAQLHYRAKIVLRSIAKDIAEETARRTAFLFVPVWLGMGAVTYFTADFEPAGLSLALLVGTLIVMRAAVRKNPPTQLLTTIMLLIALGSACAKFQTWRIATPMLGGEITTEVKAQIVSITRTAKSHRATLDILETIKPTLKYAPKRVRVTLREDAAKLRAGQTITVRLRLLPPSGPTRPTSYDFAFQAYFDGVGASGFSLGPVALLESEPASIRGTALALLENLRQTIASRIRAVIPGTEGEVAVALIAGVQAGIDETTMESLRITGLAHILSISGLHMALVAGVFLVIIRVGFSAFPGTASRLPVKKYAAGIALAASFFYLLLSGSDVAALRSFIMLAVFLTAVLLDQQALTMRNLVIAAIAILLVTPHEIMGPSFQMSFAATAALISAYAYWTKVKPPQSAPKSANLLAQLFSKTWRFLGALAMTSIIAGLATSLFSAWQFHRLAPLGLPSNLAAMPAVSLLVMPFAVLGTLLMPFGLEKWPLMIMGEGITIMLGISNYFASVSPAGISGAISLPSFALATTSLILACLLQTRLKWIALTPLPLIAMMLWTPPRPDLLISEDAKLIAVRTSNGIIAVNRERPNQFTLKSWQNALAAQTVELPVQQAGATKSHLFHCQDNLCLIDLPNGQTLTWVGYPAPPRSNKTPATQTNDQPAEPAPSSPPAFTDRAATEAILAAKFKADVATACGKSDILIVAGPFDRNMCDNPETQIISAQTLARKGMIEIYLHRYINALEGVSDSRHEQPAPTILPLKSATQPIPLKHTATEPTLMPRPERMPVSEPTSPLHTALAPALKPWPDKRPASAQHQAPPVQRPAFTITYAVGEPNRPWNSARIFSRAARNMPPFQPIPAAKPAQ
ncbi:MAG: ComEC/Rec2 family competence protein [Rhizobiaceae bacterium]